MYEGGARAGVALLAVWLLRQFRETRPHVQQQQRAGPVAFVNTPAPHLRGGGRSLRTA